MDRILIFLRFFKFQVSQDFLIFLAFVVFRVFSGVFSLFVLVFFRSSFLFALFVPAFFALFLWTLLLDFLSYFLSPGGQWSPGDKK